MEQVFFEWMVMARKAYDRALEPVYESWGLSRNELDTLLFLGNNPGLDRAADIVKFRGLAKSHVSLAVTTLERRGLLERREDPGDRRNVRLKLTEVGVQAAREGKLAQKAFFSRAFEGLSQEDFDRWRAIAGRVLGNIEAMDSQGQR